jgi:hypothetical protein
MFPIQGRCHLAFLFDLARDHTCEIALTPLTPPRFVQLRKHGQKQAELTVIHTWNYIKIRSQGIQSLVFNIVLCRTPLAGRMHRSYSQDPVSSYLPQMCSSF